MFSQIRDNFIVSLSLLFFLWRTHHGSPFFLFAAAPASQVPRPGPMVVLGRAPCAAPSHAPWPMLVAPRPPVLRARAAGMATACCLFGLVSHRCCLVARVRGCQPPRPRPLPRVESLCASSSRSLPWLPLPCTYCTQEQRGRRYNYLCVCHRSLNNRSLFVLIPF